jgi:echinoderm microtubule-associated protein-like 1/2
MMENEKGNELERIIGLEKKIEMQQDDIVCLKSALADVIRRLCQVETHQSQSSTSTQSSTGGRHNPRIQPVIKAPSNSTYSTNKPPSRQQSKEVERKNANDSISHQKGNNSSKHPVNNTNHSNKEASDVNSKSLVRKQATAKSSITINYRNEPISFNSDAGYIKLYLRGRPITLYLPTSNQTSLEHDMGYQFNMDKCIKEPSQNLKLEWVYGYRGKDCRSNIYQLPTGEIVYFIAAVVVLYNVEESTQRHYLGHTDDVKSLAIHPDRVTIATGQSTGHNIHENSSTSRACVHIWNSISLTKLKVIGCGNEFQTSICCLSFSKVDGGNHLAVIDDGTEKWLSVWNWQQRTKVAAAKCYNDLIFAAEYHPTEKNMIVTCGKQHIFFWTLDGQQLTKKTGLFDLNNTVKMTNALGTVITNCKIERPKYVLCLAFTASGDAISGDSEGNILFWNCKECRIFRVIKDAHENSSVFSLLTVNNASTNEFHVSLLSGGGKQPKIIEWNSDYQQTGRQLQIPEVNGQCRFISNGNGGQYLIGTTKNCILQVIIQNFK